MKSEGELNNQKNNDSKEETISTTVYTKKQINSVFKKMLWIE